MKSQAADNNAVVTRADHGAERHGEANTDTNIERSRLDTVIDRLAERGGQPMVLAFTASDCERHSCRALGEQVLRLARGLHARIAPGEAVALVASDSPRWMVAALAIIRAGGQVTPLDVQLAADTLTDVLADSGARWIFTDEDHVEAVRDAAPEAQLLLLDADEGRDSWQSLATGDGDLPHNHSDSAAALFYTSGTTGPPKGVPLSHGNLQFQLDTLDQAGVTREGDRVLLPLPLHHVYPFVIGMLAPVSLGLPLVIPYALTGPQLIRAIREGRASVVIGVPRLYAALFEGIAGRAAGAGRMAALGFNALLTVSALVRRHLQRHIGKTVLAPLHRQMGEQLRVLACGGAALDETLAWNLEALGWQVAVGYGLTETSPLVSLDRPEHSRPGTVGPAVPGVELHIDRERKQTVTARQDEGEIQVRGANVFSGYRNKPDKTRESLTDSGWFCTGDLGYIDEDNYLHVTGRVSTLIVTRGGENIQPDALEARYAEHPLIQEIGVLQEDGDLVALVVPAGGGTEPQRVRDAVHETGRKLASYQRLSRVALTRTPLPRTRLGKIQRHKLADSYRHALEGDDKPRQAPLAEEDMAAEDRALLERRVARDAWRWLAERYPKSGLTPDARLQSDLGLDSMGWLNLTMELGQRTGVELPESAISRIDTVRDLLKELVDASGASGSPAADPLDDPQRALGPEHRRWLQPRGPVLRAVADALYAGNRLMMRSLFRLQVRDSDNIPVQGPCIFVGNHASYLDPFAVAAALPTERLNTLYWSGWRGVAFTSALRRFGSRLSQTIPIDPEAGVRTSLALAAGVLQRERALMWFPEGERSADGSLQAFRQGIGLLLARYPVPVVPVIIDGAYEAWPRQRHLPRLRPMAVRFAPALEPEELAQRGSGEDRAARIRHGLEQVMRELLESSG